MDLQKIKKIAVNQYEKDISQVSPGVSNLTSITLNIYISDLICIEQYRDVLDENIKNIIILKNDDDQYYLTKNVINKYEAANVKISVFELNKPFFERNLIPIYNVLYENNKNRNKTVICSQKGTYLPATFLAYYFMKRFYKNNVNFNDKQTIKKMVSYDIYIIVSCIEYIKSNRNCTYILPEYIISLLAIEYVYKEKVQSLFNKYLEDNDIHENEYFTHTTEEQNIKKIYFNDISELEELKNA